MYVVLRESMNSPEFLKTSTAGWPKDRDPSVTIKQLRKSWVPDTPVLYIGKAGGAKFKSTLRTRLSAYLRHGAGRRAAHWGGRYIWQLADSERLLFAWKATLPEEPRDVERGLILGFESGYGARPFANRVR
ncbi:MAG: hypothetical protein DRP64_11815 [Verrucomicrobia bacterium]|nr:MAG: hypothetical protein DRP64_11815 [Verrucomicrobiota bacterium]